MKIGERLTVGFLGITLLLIFVGHIAINSIGKIYGIVKDQCEVYIPIEHAICDIRFTVDGIIRSCKEYDGGMITKQEVVKDIQEMKTCVEGYLNNLNAASIKAENLISISDRTAIKNAIYRLYAIGNKLFEIQGKSKEEKTPIMEDFDKQARLIHYRLDAVRSKVNNLTVESMAKVMRNFSFVINIVVIAVLLTILISFGLSFFISRSVYASILKLKKGADEIGKGNLDARVFINSKDEIGSLAGSFNKMAEELKMHVDKEKKFVRISAAAAGEMKKSEELASLNKKLQLSNEELCVVNEQVRKTKREIEVRFSELERFSRITVGRERKMRELKIKIEELEKKLKEKG